jgi:hypothetical protein
VLQGLKPGVFTWTVLNLKISSEVEMRDTAGKEEISIEDPSNGIETEVTHVFYDLGEFASIQLQDMPAGRVKIIVEANSKYKDLIASKIRELKISNLELIRGGLLK